MFSVFLAHGYITFVSEKISFFKTIKHTHRNVQMSRVIIMNRIIISCLLDQMSEKNLNVKASYLKNSYDDY